MNKLIYSINYSRFDKNIYLKGGSLESDFKQYFSLVFRPAQVEISKKIYLAKNYYNILYGGSTNSTSKKHRTIYLKNNIPISENSTNINRKTFKEWDTTHIVYVDKKKAQLDQKLFIWSAISSPNKKSEVIKDGDNLNWNKTVQFKNGVWYYFSGEKLNPKSARIITIRDISSISPHKSPSNKSAQNDKPFMVTTYNVLTGPQQGHQNSAYEQELFKDYGGRCAIEKHTKWAYRRNLVFNAIKFSDIICLNEVTKPMLDDLLKMGLNKTHSTDGVYLKQGNYDGTAILYRLNRFSAIQIKQEPIFDKYSQVFYAYFFQDMVTEKTLTVFALHLKSGYGDKEALRIRQFDTAMEKLFAIQPSLNFGGKPGNVFSLADSLIVCGDLNSDYNAKYAKLAKHITTKYKLKNVAEEMKKQRQITYNHWHPAVFDYIFIRGSLKILDFNIPDSGGITPNQTQGSDHLPVTATFQ